MDENRQDELTELVNNDDWSKIDDRARLDLVELMSRAMDEMTGAFDELSFKNDIHHSVMNSHNEALSRLIDMVKETRELLETHLSEEKARIEKLQKSAEYGKMDIVSKYPGEPTDAETHSFGGD